MDHWVAGRLIDWAAGSNESTKAILMRDLSEHADELAGPDPSPVERALADVAATSWFALRLHESHYIAAVRSEDGMTLAQSEHAQRRIDRAHRRFLSTIKTLATVRRLALPAVQVNIANRQQIAQIAGTPHEAV